MQLLQNARCWPFRIMRLHTSHVEHPIVVARVRIGRADGTVLSIHVLVVLVVGIVSAGIFLPSSSALSPPSVVILKEVT